MSPHTEAFRLGKVIHQELTGVLSALSDAVLAVSDAGETLFFNPQFSRLFGDPGADPFSKLYIFSMKEVRDAFDRTIRTGQNQLVAIRLKVNTHVTPRHFNLSVAPLMKTEKSVTGAVCVLHDITELKHAETVRIDFVANVSHELRTPLTAVKGYTDTLLEDCKQKKFDTSETYLNIISRHVERLSGLVKDLLDLSAIESDEAGQSVLEKMPIDTRELTERVLVALDSQRSAKKHDVRIVCEAAHVMADYARVEQVLTNLLENAIKYLPDGGHIEVCWMPDKAQKAVILTVRDNGPGISREHLPRIFERFYRVDQARTREMGGTGLGLAIVKHVMQRHGGRVSVKSDVGQGAEFRCEFPDVI